jgi:hypothetical protein
MGSGEFLPRFLLGLAGGVAIGVVAVLSLLGFKGHHAGPRWGVLGAGSTSSSAAWASPAELAWLERLGSWDLQLRRGLETAAAASSIRRLQSLRGGASCTGALERSVGAPPTTRLRPAYALFLDACLHLQRFGEAPTAWEANRDARRAAELLSAADQSLPPGEARALPVIAGATRASRVEPRFGRLASALAGKPVQVRCWSRGDWAHLMQEERAYTNGQLGDGTLAFASIGGGRINVGPAVCAALVDLTYRHLRPVGESARLTLATGVVTLSHEPQHSRGIADEATAECYAIQLANRTAVDLGASVDYAAALVRAYWAHYADELPAYRSPECREGGALDLRRADSIWR